MFKSFSSNRRSSSGAAKSISTEEAPSLALATVDAASSTTVPVLAVELEGSDVLPLPFPLALSASFSSGTSFHLKEASIKPSPFSSGLVAADGGEEASFFKEETCSETSSSSR